MNRRGEKCPRKTVQSLKLDKRVEELASHFPGSPGNPINLSFTVILTTVFLNVTEVPASLNLNPIARPHRVCSASSTGQVLWSGQAGHTQLEEGGLPEAPPPLLGLWVHEENVGPWWGAWAGCSLRF